MNDLLTLDVLVEVKKAAPRVTAVPFDVARLAVSGMSEFSRSEKPCVDQEGKIYWEVTVGAFHKFCKFDEKYISINALGRALKALGLESWRKTDGFHVAFSQGQLDILSKHFLKAG